MAVVKPVSECIEGLKISTIHPKSPYSCGGLPCMTKYGTVNPTKGCVHNCIYCYARAFQSAGKDGTLGIYADLPKDIDKRLERESGIGAKRIYFSTSCDAFQPIPGVQEATRGALYAALRHGREVSFLTKGQIDEKTMEVLRAFPSKVFAQIGLITLDPEIAKLVEPGAPLPELRLKQAKMLVDAGIYTSARIDPMLPGITDSREKLEALFAAFKSVGIKHVSCSYLFLRPKIRENMAMGKSPVIAEMLKLYEGISATRLQKNSSMIALPKARREAGYALVVEAAKAVGIAINICSCKNQDIEDAVCCNIAGPATKTAVPSTTTTTTTTSSCKKQKTLDSFCK